MKIKKLTYTIIFSAFLMLSIIGMPDKSFAADKQKALCLITYTNMANMKQATFTRVISSDEDYKSCLNEQSHAMVEIKKL